MFFLGIIVENIRWGNNEVINEMIYEKVDKV